MDGNNNNNNNSNNNSFLLLNVAVVYGWFDYEFYCHFSFSLATENGNGGSAFFCLFSFLFQASENKTAHEKNKRRRRRICGRFTPLLFLSFFFFFGLNDLQVNDLKLWRGCARMPCERLTNRRADALGVPHTHTHTKKKRENQETTEKKWTHKKNYLLFLL